MDEETDFLKLSVEDRCVHKVSDTVKLIRIKILHNLFSLGVSRPGYCSK